MASPRRNSATFAVCRARESNLFGRWVNSLNFSRGTALDQHFGECTVAAADVHAFLTGG
jgi:hypothetical protein